MKKIIIILTFVFSIPSCRFLKEGSSTGLLVSDLYQTIDDAVNAVNVCYAKIPFGEFHYDIMLEMTTDTYVTPVAKMKVYQMGQYSANHKSVQQMWKGIYSMIYHCNTVLDRVPAISTDDTGEIIKNRCLAEASFLRAVGYFDLVRTWGSVPLRLSAIYDGNYDQPKAPVKEIYDAIVKDLEFAIENLEEKYSGADCGRATCDAARTLLAKVYMTMAGSDENSPYWAEAEEYARQCIDHLGGLDNINNVLCPHYGDLWKTENKLHPEYLFTNERLALPELGQSLTGAYAASSDYSGANWSGNRRLAPELYNSFEPRNIDPSLPIKDLRFIEGVHSTFTETVNGVTTKYFWPALNKGTLEKSQALYKNMWGELPPSDCVPAYKKINDCFLLKYDDPLTTFKDSGGPNVPYIRYAETVLIFAEAENELNGPTVDAQKAVNAIRKRAGLSPTNQIDSKEEFRKQILKERRCEFYAEHIRRYDLLRRGVYVETMNAFNKSIGNNAYVRTEKNKLLPIPFEELSSNKALTQDDQNPGW